MYYCRKLHFIIILTMIVALTVTSLTLPVRTIAEAPIPASVTIEADVLNVRAQPGLEYQIMAKVNQGETYPVTAQQDKWYQIRLSADQQGWVANWLVTPDSSSVIGMTSTVAVLNVRDGPSKSFSVIEQIHQGEAYPLLERQGDWVKIKLSDNRSGWVAAWLVEQQSVSSNEVTTTGQATAIVQVPILNVRSGPSAEHRKLGQVTKGETLQILDVSQGWYHIKFQGNDGWIAGEFASLDGQASSNQGSDQNETGEDTNQTPPTSSKDQVQVKPQVLNLRNGPSMESDVIGSLSQGTLLTVLKREEYWFRVQTPDKKTGWVANWLVVKPGQLLTNQPQVKILNKGTNIRSGPGTDHEVVTRANPGDTFPVVETEGDWFKIRLADGSTAYVAGWIVSAQGVPNVQRPSLSTYLKGKTIVVDAGHGGRDDGATGPHLQTDEKIVNLKVSRILAAKLRSAGANVIMTRDDDRYIPLQGRVDIAVHQQADAFISIHHNSHENQRVSGTITYFYSNGNDRVLANYIQQEVVKRNGRNDLRARRGNFYVLRENPVLAVLVELGFLTNYQEEVAIRGSDFQENSAEGIFQGVLRYFKEQ